MSKLAVIVAGGSGMRMGNELPKQFLLLDGKPILLYAIDAFLSTFHDINIHLVLPKQYMDYTRELLNNFGYSSSIQLIEGGATRFHSVKNGISHAGQDDIIFVHDAVRCLVSKKLIERCYEKALSIGSAIPVIPIRDSMRRVGMNGTSEVVSREYLYSVQTPQTFKASILVPAFQVDYMEKFTDEATVVEHAGINIQTVEGEEQNIKITYPDDLLYAKWRLSIRQD
jgi:2-C-methyl-D-erythritol 4-phosphate cytidylyltransferase